MAGPFDFFTPGPANASEDASTPQAHQQFQGFLDDPRGRAALLQAGLSLLGGRSWGDNPASQVARAIGSSGEAVRTSEEENRAAEEAASKIAERGSRAGARGEAQDARQRALDIAQQKVDLTAAAQAQKAQQFQQQHDLNKRKYDGLMAIAQSRVDNATNDQERKKARDEVDRIAKEARTETDRINSDYARQRLEAGTTKEQGVQSRSEISNTIRLQDQYRKEQYAIDKYNTRAQLYGNTPKPALPPFKQWRAERMGTGGDTTAPPATTTTPPAKPAQPSGSTQLSPDFSPPAGWQVNRALQQYRDPATGQVYDPHGKPVTAEDTTDTED